MGNGQSHDHSGGHVVTSNGALRDVKSASTIMEDEISKEEMEMRFSQLVVSYTFTPYKGLRLHLYACIYISAVKPGTLIMLG